MKSAGSQRCEVWFLKVRIAVPKGAKLGSQRCEVGRVGNPVPDGAKPVPVGRFLIVRIIGSWLRESGFLIVRIGVRYIYTDVAVSAPLSRTSPGTRFLRAGRA